MPAAGLLAQILTDALVPARVHRECVVMGTRLRIVVDHGPRPAALAAAEAALREIERFDRVLTTWDASSPMSRLNRAPLGCPLPVEDAILDLLVEADRWVARTGGCFDPAVGALVDAWGLRRGGALPEEDALAWARSASGPGSFSFDDASRTATRRRAGAWIDTGCFGKGAALRSAERVLGERGVRSALIDLGGQLLAVGRDASTQAPWEIGIAHPSRRHVAVARLRVEDASVATSGHSERSPSARGERIGHLLDPGSGRPAPLWGSVTVVASDALVADVLSTALYVMGPGAGLEWSLGLDEGVLFLEEGDGEAPLARGNPALERFLVAGSIPYSSRRDR